MALTVRAQAVKAAPAARCTARPAAVRPAVQKAAAAGLASLAFAATIAAAPAEAHNVISTVASAAEGYPFVPPSWAPSLFVPLTGLVLPAITMATLFAYIEKEAPEQ